MEICWLYRSPLLSPSASHLSNCLVSARFLFPLGLITATDTANTRLVYSLNITENNKHQVSYTLQGSIRQMKRTCTCLSDIESKRIGRDTIVRDIYNDLKELQHYNSTSNVTGRWKLSLKCEEPGPYGEEMLLAEPAMTRSSS